MLSQKAASAGVPTPVVSSTIRAAMLVAAGQAAAGVISVKVAALTGGVMKAMFVTKLKVATAVLLVALAAVGSGGFLCRMQAAQQGHSGGQFATPVPGAGQVARAEKNPKEDKDQESLKAAVVKALADVQAARDELISAEIRLKSLTERYQRLKEAYEKEKAKPLWTLDFLFRELRLVPVEGRPQGQARKAVWYCWYEVSNPTDEAHTFIPDFELVTADRVYHDTVFPGVQEAVRRIEDPEQTLDMKNSVTIAKKPIPPSKQAAGQNKYVVGVAFWEGVDPDARSMTVFVGGLSNDWTSDGDTVRRKTLKLSFKRVGNEMRFAGPAEWVYRSTKLHEEQRDNDQQGEIERRSWTKDWQVVEMGSQGATAYINLGSSDGITPGVAFRVRDRGLDSKPNPAKGTLEVVRVIGPHLSQAAVTSVKDPRADPIRKGDQLFNPTRNPGKQVEEMPEKARHREGEEEKSVIESKGRVPEGRPTEEGMGRGEIEKTKQAIAAAEKQAKEWQKQREHLQAVVSELERQVKSGDAADLNGRIELEILNQRLKQLEASPAVRDKP